MEKINETEISKSYEGKSYNLDSLRKIASGYGESGAIVYYGRLSKPLFDLFGITEEILNNWINNDIFFSVVLDLDEDCETIKECRIAKRDASGSLPPTDQEIRVFREIMNFITNIN